MDVIDPILNIATEIYCLVEKVKANKKRCRRVSQRVKALEDLVSSIQQKKAVRTCVEVEKALKELRITLESAQELIKRYTLATWVERILNSNSHGDEFSSVNERLNDAFQILSGALQVEHSNMLYKVFELTSREKEDEVDRMEDEKELQRLLLEHVKDLKEKTEAMVKQLDHVSVNVDKVVEMCADCSFHSSTNEPS
ncbi:mixed lineage kinase domain-like protein [Stegastes partitus]|uniref:Mixed lineage kinase domain-like protein n=1 Tax=Stegastes partitus TaxID=144197 RepID=A0A9Y4NWM7_9TELE|nr:PREDICTED: mixed lineage kinase domain-like protein [Stegastes partitus]